MNSKHALYSIFSVFSPLSCPACKQAILGPDSNLCAECLEKIRFVKSPFCPSCGGENDGIFKVCRFCLKEEVHPWNNALSLMHFEGNGRELIHRFKYQNDTALARPLGLLAGEKLKSSGLKADMIVPVPLHWLNYLVRGYNQSRLFSSFISKSAGIPLVNALKRVKWTKRQAKLDKNERRKNILKAFSVIDSEICRNKSILLVDDVITTGATLKTASKALLEAGAREINILTLARG